MIVAAVALLLVAAPAEQPPEPPPPPPDPSVLREALQAEAPPELRRAAGESAPPVRGAAEVERARAALRAADAYLAERRAVATEAAPDGPLLPLIEEAEIANARAEAALDARSSSARADALAEAERALRAVAEADEARLRALRARVERPTLLVVSGGVSLGAYQAGFLHYYTRFLLAYRDYLRRVDPTLDADRVKGFQLATGASAGSMNAFLALLTACRKPVDDPEQSLFFQAWIPVGMERLFDARGVQANALLSRAPIEDAVKRITDLWDDPTGWDLDQGCEALLGMSVTPVTSREIEIVPAHDDSGAAPAKLVVRRLSEKFMFRLARGPDGRLAFFPFSPPKTARLAEFYPVLGDRSSPAAYPIATIAELLKASSSFPVAFEPIPLTYTIPSRRPQTAAFIDGGVFDNTPLRLAARMHEWSADAADLASSARGGKDAPWLLFVEPDAVAWPTAGPAPSGGGRGGIFDVYVPFLANLLSSTRQAELLETFESDRALADRLVMPTRHLPVASSHLSAFLGFFERDFRVFDFYMGMADAQRHLRDHSDQYAELTRAGGQVPALSPVFRCFAAYGAAGGNVRAPRALLRECAALDVDEPQSCGPISSSGVADPVCPRNMLALLDASTRLRDEIMLGEVTAGGEAERFLTLLGAAGYRYRTVALGSNGSTALARIRDRLEQGLDRLGAKQGSFAEKAGVWVGGKAAANTWWYRAPLRTASLGVLLDRGLEAGLTETVAVARGYPVRLGATLRLYQLDKLELGGEDGEVYALTLMPALAASTDVRLGRQLRMELGAGWGLQLREGITPLTHLMWRHGPEVSLTFVAMQRLYAQAGVTWFLDGCANDNRCSRTGGSWRDRPNPVTTHEREYRLSIGWRALLR